jgi:hypothetical protein
VRLPFIQVADEAFEKARELGDIIGLSQAETLGRLLLLWRATLTWAPDGTPVDGSVHGPSALRRVASAFQWREDPTQLADLLEEIGFGQHLPDGYRVRGVPARYGTALARRKHIADVRSKAGKAGNAKRWLDRKIAKPSQTHRQTETETFRRERSAAPFTGAGRTGGSRASAESVAGFEKKSHRDSQSTTTPQPPTVEQARFVRLWDERRRQARMKPEGGGQLSRDLLTQMQAMIDCAKRRESDDPEFGWLALEQMVSAAISGKGSLNAPTLVVVVQENVWRVRLDRAFGVLSEVLEQKRERARRVNNY